MRTKSELLPIGAQRAFMNCILWSGFDFLFVVLDLGASMPSQNVTLFFLFIKVLWPQCYRHLLDEMCQVLKEKSCRVRGYYRSLTAYGKMEADSEGYVYFKKGYVW
jgi:hypothetical protein